MPKTRCTIGLNLFSQRQYTPFAAWQRALRNLKCPPRVELQKYIRETLQGVTLAIRVQPRSSRDEIIVDPTSDQLKVRITAPPVDSAANKAMLKFIAKSLGIPPRTASLIRGEKSRNKTVLVTGPQAKTVAGKLRTQK